MEFDGTPLLFHTSSTVHAIWSDAGTWKIWKWLKYVDVHFKVRHLMMIHVFRPQPQRSSAGGPWWRWQLIQCLAPLRVGNSWVRWQWPETMVHVGIKHIFEIGWDYQLFSTVILNISQLSNSVSHYFHTIPTFQKFLRVMHCTPDCFVNRLPPQRALGPSTTKAWAPSSPAYSRLTSVCKVVCLVSHSKNW